MCVCVGGEILTEEGLLSGLKHSQMLEESISPLLSLTQFQSLFYAHFQAA